MVLVFRCANGNALWYFRRTRNPDQSVAVCLNNNDTVPIATRANASWAASLQSIYAKTVALRGAIVALDVLEDAVR